MTIETNAVPSLYRLMETALHEAVGSLRYYKPEAFDDAAHETAWKEMIEEKTELLTRVQAADEPRFTFDHVYAAACAWEYAMEKIREGMDGKSNPWHEYRVRYGMPA